MNTTTPAANAVVSGNVSWQVNATATGGVKQVAFYIDNVWKWTEGLSPYVFNGDGNTWNTRTVADGVHQLKVIATSNSNETATQVINVTVANTVAAPVSLAITAPAANSTVSGNVPWTAAASSTDGIRQVVFYIDNVSKWTEGQSPYVYNGDGNTWNTSTVTDGVHQLKVVATSNRNATATQVINVTVANNVLPPPAAVDVVTTTPLNGALLSGDASWIAIPISDDEIAQVEFFIDDVSMDVSTTSPYVYDGVGNHWDTTTVADGVHQLKVIATSVRGVTATDVVSVTVNNAPPAPVTVSTTAPAANSTVEGFVPWTANAASTDGVKKIEFFIDGVSKYIDFFSPFVFNGDGNTWNTATVSDGVHALRVTATSNRDATATQTINVTVDNAPPAPVTVNTTAPAANATVSGNVPWTATASSADGIEDVEFSIDGVPKWTDTSSPYAYNVGGSTWNSLTVPNGVHQLTVTATSIKQATAAQTINVTVTNILPPVPGLTASVEDFSHIQLFWGETPGATSTQLFRDGTLIATRPQTQLHYSDSMLWYSTTYSYTLRALNSSGGTVATYGPVSATTPALPAGGYPAPFGNHPLWSTPIPPNAPLWSGDAAYASHFLSHDVYNPNMTLRSFGVPVYETDAYDTRYGPLTCRYACDINRAGPVPFPQFAAPDPSSDAHMAVLSRDGLTGYDYYKPLKNSSGVWTGTSAGVYVDMNGNGVISKNLAGANAANFALLAGLVRPEELAQGHIDHALVIGLRGIADGPPACPATHNVGTGTNTVEPPEGARMRLNPSVNVDALAIPAWQKTIARALQTYGAYIRDNSGSLSIYGESSSPTLGGRRYDGWAKANVGLSTTSGSQGFSSAFPWSSVHVLDFKYGPDC